MWFFCEQVVVVEGENPTGRAFIVRRLFTAQPMLPPPLFLNAVGSSVETLSVPGVQNGTGELRIVIACGPFSSNDALDYVPLYELGQRLLRERAHILLLLGPFVDLRHPLVSSYHDMSYSQLLERKLLIIMRFCRRCSTISRSSCNC